MEYLGDSKPVNLKVPLVSVCVATFQHFKFIEKCLQSILQQKTSFDYEILIGEDVSTDGTRELCIRYAEKHPDLIRLFLRDSQEKKSRKGKWIGKFNHLGLYGAARGKYVCFCDGDDHWVNENKLQLQVNALEAYPEASICITNTWIEGDKTGYPPGLPDRFTVFSTQEMKRKNYLGHISSWMVRNEMRVFLANPVLKRSSFMDMLVFTFYRMRGCTIYLPEVTSCYVLNPAGIYRSNTSKQNHLHMIRINWLLFYYLHKDPVHFLRSLGYQLKRYLANN